MTTTTPHTALVRGRNFPQRRYARTIDRLIARFGMSMLRWAGDRNRRRVLTAEAHTTLHALEAERSQRELAAQRLLMMRGY